MMGIAAYYRGNAAISRQYCDDRGCTGCVNCSTPTPQKRPEEWGQKAYVKALGLASGLLDYCCKRDGQTPSAGHLADMVCYAMKVGRATAERAAEEAIENRKKSRR